MEATIPYPLSANEAARLRALHEAAYLELPRHEAFDRLANLAARLLQTPVGIITLMDAEWQAFKACYGADLEGTPRELAFCNHTIAEDSLVVFENLRADARFVQHPFVAGPPHVAFYAGAPLRNQEGYVVGTLCVLDMEPRTFSMEEQTLLADLAALVVDAFELRREVKQRQHTEAVLRESEARKAAILEASLDCIITINEESQILEFNEAAEKTFGYRRSDVMGQPLHDLLIPEAYRAAHQAGMQRYMQTGHGPVLYQRVEVEALRADGTVIPVELAVSPIRLRDGREHFTAHLRDISERKATEAALRESENRYRHLVEHAADIIYRADLHGHFTFVNANAAQVTGYEIETLQSLSFTDLLDPQEVPGHRAFYERQFREQIPETYLEFPIRTRHSGRRWIGQRVQLVREGGRIVGFQGVARDITDRKIAQDALQRSEAKYRHLFSGANDPILIFDPETEEVLEANEAASRTYGLPHEELVGTSLKRFTLEDSPGQAGIEEVLEKGTLDGFETTHRRPDGTLLHLRASASCVQLDGRLAIMSINRDVTEQKQAEAVLREALVRERELGELKSRFVSMVSHEFRTPLAMIQSSAQLARHYYRQGSAKTEKHLGRIEAGVAEMTELLEDVLLLGRAEAGRLTAKPVPCNVQELLDQVIEDIQDGLPQPRDIVVTGAIPPGRVEADRKLLRLIFNNLLTNAVKYAPPEAPILVTLGAEEKSWHATIADEGIGIPQADLARLFEPFHRAANVGNIPGTGLGLALVRQAVEGMGGAVAVESTVGKGTCFSVTVPCL